MCLAILGHYALKGPDYIQFKHVYFRRLEQIYLRIASLRYYKKFSDLMEFWMVFLMVMLL